MLDGPVVSTGLEYCVVAAADARTQKGLQRLLRAVHGGPRRRIGSVVAHVAGDVERAHVAHPFVNRACAGGVQCRHGSGPERRVPTDAVLAEEFDLD